VVRVLLVVMLAGVLAAAAVACPLSIAPLNHREMPCHQCGNTSNRCSAMLCQASSPYLTPQQSTVHKVLLKEMPAEAVNPGFWHSPATPISFRGITSHSQAQAAGCFCDCTLF
jgi:hypothetical protein